MNVHLLIISVLACLLNVSIGLADTLVLQNDGTESGTVLQTNGDTVLLLTDDGAFNYLRTNLKEIRTEQRPTFRVSRGTGFPIFTNPS